LPVDSRGKQKRKTRIAAKGTDLAKNLQKRLLRQILGLHWILADSQTEVVNAPAVRVVKVFEGSSIALASSLDGFSLGQPESYFPGDCVCHADLPSALLLFVLHGDFLSLRQFFLRAAACLLSDSWAFPGEAVARSKRRPRNFNNSSAERKRISVEESTSSTHPSNKPSAGRVSFPSRSTNASRISMKSKTLLLRYADLSRNRFAVVQL
jgi:hypothetical protein